MLLVSSPNHMPRCLHLAMIEKQKRENATVTVSAHPSNVNFEGASIEDVVIIEPPHLPGPKKIPWHTLFQQMLPMVRGNEHSEAFAKDLEALLREYEDAQEE